MIIGAGGNVNSLKKYLLAFVLSYLFIFVCLSITHSGMLPLREHSFIQICLLIFYSLFLYGSLYASVNKFFVLILLYQIVFSFLLNTYFFDIVNKPFGYRPVDAIVYMDLSEYALNHTLSDLLVYLKARNTEISDYGFPIIRFFIFNLAGNLDRGILFMVMVNAIAMVIASWYLYKLSFFFMNKTSSKIVALFWGLNICSIVSNVIGLKETIFTTILIITMYQVYYFYYKKNDLSHFLIMILCIALTVLFRIYLTVFFIIIILFRPIYSNRFKKLALFLVVSLTLVSAYIGYFISSTLPILNALFYAQKIKGNLLFINMIAGFLGPFPNFLKVENLDLTALFWAPYSGFKTFFSIFGLYGGLCILKRHITKLYPLFFYVFFNILLVIGTVRSFDYRFSYTMIPFFFILIMYGFERFRFKSKKIISYLYFCVIFILVYAYNIR
jgi:hypothetical protein